MTGETAVACASCGAALLPGDRYCEQCGARVGSAHTESPAERGCHACGAPADAIDSEGRCADCGVHQREPDRRVEVDVVLAAGVSDCGCVHQRNDDALHVEALGESVVAIVCDGISSSIAADVAARRAAGAAGRVLSDALRNGDTLGKATEHAIDAAQRAVLSTSASAAAMSTADLDPPSCTFVSAACRGGEIVIGWVGDSRAYWIASTDSRQLTVDNSWAEEQIAAGSLSAEQAHSDPRAHSITRWLGTDAPDDPPQIVTLRPQEPGRLLLCSDGLWNYVPSAAGLAALINALPDAAAPVAVAHSLTDTAVGAGGHDNITVAVVDIRPPKGGDR